MREEYDLLLKSGMFWVLFPSFSGVWEKDMISFIEFKVTKHSHLDY